jgi:hypothetical protein
MGRFKECGFPGRAGRLVAESKIGRSTTGVEVSLC